VDTPALSYAGFYGQSFEAFVEEAARLGFRSVEFIPDQSPNLLAQLTPARRRDLASLLKQNGIVPTVHSIFYDINLVSVVPEIQQFSLSMIRRCGELCVELGGTEMTVHPGYQFPGWRSSQWQREIFLTSMRNGIELLSTMCRDLAVTAFLENGSYFLTTRFAENRIPLHYGAFLDELELISKYCGGHVGFCLDLGKAVASGLNLPDLLASVGARQFRFQLGSIDSWNTLMEIAGAFDVMRSLGQVTYEGPLDQAGAFLAHVQAGWMNRSKIG
jgi:sugar phosphate isomerase/epimerase